MTDDPPGVPARGRVCLVTGATNGIGRATAQALAASGATVVVHGRNREKAEQTVAAIRQATGNAGIESIVADLSALDQVRAMAAELHNRHYRLHVLVNNAGLWALDRRTTSDGFEAHFGINHLAPFLLTNLVLDLLKAAAPARIVTVSSNMHRRGRIDFADLQSEQSYRGTAAYSASKLANVLFTIELARRLEGTGLTANSLHPGAVATGLGADNTGIAALAWKLDKLFMMSPEKGARTSVYLAQSAAVDGISGRYFVDRREAPAAPAAQDSTTPARLWEVSAELAGLQS